MVYLNEDFQGGETAFKNLPFRDVKKLTISPKVGMALDFNHAHLHKGAMVSSGVKYVIRTDVMYE